CWSCINHVRKIQQERRMQDDDEPPALRDDSDDEEELTVKVSQMDPDIILPKYKSEEAAGLDIATAIDVIIEPQNTTIISTGIKMELPPNHVGILKTPSSLAKSEISIQGGVIDSDYRGEVLVLARNQNPTIPFAINKGDRIAQMVILPVAQPK